MTTQQSMAASSAGVGAPIIRHKRHDPVFIVGHGRSGTSILADLVRKHLRIAFGTESQFFIRYFRRLEAYGDLTSEPNRRLLLEDLGRERFFQRSRKYGVRLDVDRAVREADPTYAGVLTAIMRQSADCQGMERWGDKTPEYSRHLLILRQLFPSAQFIHIVRDGRDVALSGYLMHFGAKNAYTAATEWRDVLAEVNACAATLPPSQFLEVRYEDLLTQTSETFRRLVRFLEVEDPDGRVSEAVARLARGELRAGNFNKWRTELSQAEQEMFTVVAGPYLTRYGYDLTPTTRSAPGILGGMYWHVDNAVRRMLMPEYWADNVYKARILLREKGLPLRSWRRRRVESDASGAAHP